MIISAKYDRNKRLYFLFAQFNSFINGIGTKDTISSLISQLWYVQSTCNPTI